LVCGDKFCHTSGIIFSIGLETKNKNKEYNITSTALYEKKENKCSVDLDSGVPAQDSIVMEPQTPELDHDVKAEGQDWRKIWLNMLDRAMDTSHISGEQRLSMYKFVHRYLTANPWPPLNIHLYRLEGFINLQKKDAQQQYLDAIGFFYTKVKVSERHTDKIEQMKAALKQLAIQSKSQVQTQITQFEHIREKPEKPAARITVNKNTNNWLEATILEIKVRNYSNSTKKEYVRIIKEFLTFIKSEPKEITTKEVKEYIVNLKDNQKFSPSTINNYKSALTFFFREVLERERFMLKIPRMRQPKNIPEHFSKSEITSLIQVTHNLKHRVLIASIYGMGLRLSEAISLKARYLRFEDLETHIHLGKGQKDRIVVLKDRLSRILKSYTRNLNPEDYIFPGRKQGSHLSRRSAQKVLETACRKAKTPGKRNVHKLRHSFANHLLEDGVPTAIIKELLGHKQLKTTELYSHPTRAALKKFNNPLNNIDF